MDALFKNFSSLEYNLLATGGVRLGMASRMNANEAKGVCKNRSFL